ncbi:MAG TPA: phage terminase large subunit [Candidatus Paceibacterota bacterium]|nr:phage terminase large subunit [Candidatus Paceibacterota bacterium]
MKTSKQNKITINELCHFTAKQKEASRAVKEYRFVLFGGAMGGGKSYFLRWKLLRMLLAFNARGIKHVIVGLFCEDYPSLNDRHLSKVRFEFPSWLGDYNLSEHNFILKERWGGGTLAFRNLDDVSKYQSSEFAVIAIDELTRNKEEVFDVLRTRLRWPGIEDTRFITASNPGGIGHEWVKKRWIDGVHYSNEKEPNQFVYIPALLKDNSYIDPSYLLQIQSIPDEKKRNAYLKGNWDIFEGQYFSEWDKEKHVVEPFSIPDSWFRFRSIDVSGRSGITSCHWYALDHGGNVWVYREHYATGLDSDQHAKRINELSEGEEYKYTVYDSSADSKLGLPETTAEVYFRNGVSLNIPSSKSRVMGWDTVHRYLRWDERTEPKLKIFNNCVSMIRTIPALIHDKINLDDVDMNGESHAADDLRYFLQTLRDNKTPRPLTLVQKRIVEIRIAAGDENPYEGLFPDETQ